MYFLQILEARISRSRCRFLLRVMRDESVPGFSPWLIDGGLLPGSSHCYPFLCVYAQMSSFQKDSRQYVLGSTLIISINTSVKTLFPNQFPHSVCWGLEPQYMNLGGQNSTHNITLPICFLLPSFYTLVHFLRLFFFFFFLTPMPQFLQVEWINSILCFSSFLFTISLCSSQYFFQ